MKTQFLEIDGAVAADPVGIAHLRRPAVSYATALWVSRLGRIGALWLPISSVCLAHAAGSWPALEATVIFLLVWKAALRRAYSDASVTVWTIGSFVPAAVGACTGALLVVPIATWIPALHLSGTAILMMTACVALTSTAWEALVARSLAARRRVLVVGAARGGAELLDDIALAPDLPFEVVGIVDDVRETDQVAGVPLLGGVDDLTQIVVDTQPQLIVLADEWTGFEAAQHLVEIGHLGFSVVSLAEFYEFAFGRLPLRSLTPTWFMSILNVYRRPYSQAAQRAFDVAVAIVAGVIVLPILPVLYVLVRRTGPAIFKQVRLGEGGKPFTIYKFRTMRVDAEANGAVWAMERDPRVTPLGRVMRKTRLDELPQLWNVLRGEMSIVGPRPERPEFVAELQKELPFWGRRHLVKPGITGWAQIRRGYTADAAGTGDKLSYDLWYLRHRSLVVDLAICAKTFSTLLSGSGAR